jgi:site-specific DNA-methyltransferase (adenine-specific)
MASRPRKPTATSNFGVSRREAHDASAFYARFETPVLSDDEAIAERAPVAEPFRCVDIREDPAPLPDASVALVVTSPPYFAGKQYEEELGAGGIPASYTEYLQMLEGVFAECVRVLEPGGRIAVNVANLGRKPYRSLAADVIGILQDRLRLLLRGEVVWQKGAGASGSCAWGSFRNPANPTLRDLTERVVIASKGRFDRVQSKTRRATASADEFMAATLDVWDIPPERAQRVGHPAPFPVELPERLIHLYTYEDDLVLDPFMGSGSAMVAAARTRRRYVGYDLDPAYCRIASERVAAEGAPVEVPRPARTIKDVAEQAIADAGFTDIQKKHKPRGLGIEVPFTGKDRDGVRWTFEVAGGFTTTRSGARVDVAWREAGRASVLAANGHAPVVLLTSHLPTRRSEADIALRGAGPATVFDVIELLDGDGMERLAKYAAGGAHERPVPGFWSARDLD